MQNDPVARLKARNRVINSYELPNQNIDKKTVESFGEEWNSFHGFSESDIKISGDKYFDIVTDEMLNKESLVIDIGIETYNFFIPALQVLNKSTTTAPNVNY